MTKCLNAAIFAFWLPFVFSQPHQPYLPALENDARVVEPYRPLLKDGRVLQPYKPYVNPMDAKTAPDAVLMRSRYRSYRPMEKTGSFKSYRSSQRQTLTSQPKPLKPLGFSADLSVQKHANRMVEPYKPSLNDDLALRPYNPYAVTRNSLNKQKTPDTVLMQFPYRSYRPLANTGSFRPYRPTQEYKTHSLQSKPLVVIGSIPSDFPVQEKDVRVVQPYEPFVVVDDTSSDLPVEENDARVNKPYKPLLDDRLLLQPYGVMHNGIKAQEAPDAVLIQVSDRSSSEDANWFRPYRPTERQGTIPPLQESSIFSDLPIHANEARVVEPYKPLLLKDGLVVEPYAVTGNSIDTQKTPDTFSVQFPYRPLEDSDLSLPYRPTQEQETFSTQPDRSKPLDVVDNITSDLPVQEKDARVVEPYQPLLKDDLVLGPSESSANTHEPVDAQKRPDAGSMQFPYRPIEDIDSSRPYRPGQEQETLSTQPKPSKPLDVVDNITSDLPVQEMDAGVVEPYKPLLLKDGPVVEPHEPYAVLHDPVDAQKTPDAVSIQFPYRPLEGTSSLRPYRPTQEHETFSTQPERPKPLDVVDFIPSALPVQEKDAGVVEPYQPLLKDDLLLQPSESYGVTHNPVGAQKTPDDVSTQFSDRLHQPFEATGSSQPYRPTQEQEASQPESESYRPLDVMDNSTYDHTVDEKGVRVVDADKPLGVVDNVSANVLPNKSTDLKETQPSFQLDTTTSTGYCSGLASGTYRHPEKCDGIIRCEEGKTFLMPACPSGLFFNNYTKTCDYPSYVPNCAPTIGSDVKVDEGCKGSEHGAHIADPQDCKVFWRCVWTKLQRMECPKGTFFNEITSVCDWPNEVPECNADGVRVVEVSGQSQEE